MAQDRYWQHVALRDSLPHVTGASCRPCASQGSPLGRCSVRCHATTVALRASHFAPSEQVGKGIYVLIVPAFGCCARAPVLVSMSQERVLTAPRLVAQTTWPQACRGRSRQRSCSRSWGAAWRAAASPSTPPLAQVSRARGSGRVLTGGGACGTRHRHMHIPAWRVLTGVQYQYQMDAENVLVPLNGQRHCHLNGQENLLIWAGTGGLVLFIPDTCVCQGISAAVHKGTS